MTTLTFSHGIVRHSTDTGLPSGNQDYLVINSDKVDLHAPLDSSLVSIIAHRDTNYLLTLQANGDIQAWGYGNVANNNAPMDNLSGGGLATNEYYLYIDIDKVTGSVSYGYTIHEPVAGSTSNFSAMNRPDDLHWFDTSKKITNVWRANGIGPAYGSWREKIRLFVGKYIYSASFISMSINAPSFIGTTVGISGTNRAGALIFDVGGKPVLRTDANDITVFFTTEDIITSGMPVTASPVSGNRMRFETFIVDAVGVMPAAAYSMVRFSDLNEVSPLQAATQANDLYGLIEFPIGATGDLIQVTMNGVVRNPLWDWSVVNQQIFVDKDNDGSLVTVEDDGYVPLPGQLPVALAIDSKSILIRRPEIALTTGSGTGGVTDHDDLTNKGTNTHATIDTHLADATLHYTVAAIDHTLIANIGSNSHAVLDAHLTNTSNPHSSSIDNLTDTTITGGAKGDILVHDGSDWVDFTVGANGLVLSANSAQTEGLEWVAASSGINNVVEDTSPDLGGDLQVGAFTILGLTANPSNATEATSKAYVDALSAGLDPKESCRLGTTTDLATETGNGWVAAGSGVGKTLTQTGVGTAQIDGVFVANQDRILVKDEAGGLGGSHNGIYTVSGVGTTVILTRSTDQDGSPAAEVSGGNFTYIEQGTQIGSGWVVVHNGLVSIDVSVMNWTQIGGTGGAFALGGLTDVTDGSAGSHTNSIRYAFQGTGTDLTVPVNDTLNDADGDTRIRLEASADEDTLRIDTGDNIGGYPAQTNILTLSSGALVIDMGDADTGGYTGAPITITAGSGAGGYGGGGAGGAITMDAGDGNGSYAGGNFTARAGDGGDEDGGNVLIRGGNAGGGGYGSGYDGGNAALNSGNGSGVGNGGKISLYAGPSGSSGAGYSYGGPIDIFGGPGLNDADGGLVRIISGSGIASSGDAANLELRGGDGGAAGNAGNGGNVVIAGGDGDTSTGNVIISNAGTSRTEVRFNHDGGSNYVSLQAPSSVTTSRTWDLPQDDPSTSAGQVMTTDASGVLSFKPVPYDLGAQAIGVIGTTVGTPIMHMQAVRSFRILASPVARGHAVTGPGTTSAIFTVSVNGGSIGTITFTVAGGSAQSVTTALTQTDVSAGDIVDVKLTTADDGTLADVMITIPGIEL